MRFNEEPQNKNEQITHMIPMVRNNDNHGGEERSIEIKRRIDEMKYKIRNN
jgi:hypothetical protein